MRRSVALVAMPLALLVIAGDAAVAQTDLTRADKRVMRQQDEQECRRQAAAQSITSRNLAEFIRKCMAERQGERRAAERGQAAEQRQIRRGMAVEEWTEIQKVRNQERRQQLEQQAVKRAQCNKQANEQRLRLRERRDFIKKCTAT
jgi:hypothetical protein